MMLCDSLIWHSLDFVYWKHRKPVLSALRQIFRASDAEAGLRALLAFEAGRCKNIRPSLSSVPRVISSIWY